jgi:1-acyl-sn-glycerol-3-phosphate acyltransferase
MESDSLHSQPRRLRGTVSTAQSLTQLACLHVLLIGLGIGSLAWNLTALLLHPLLPRDRGLEIGRAAISRVYRVFWRTAQATGLLRMDASAVDSLRDERGLIIVSNHPTVLDALMLVARLPRAACLMKANLMRNPFLGPATRLARYIRNDTAVGTIRCCVRDLRAGGQLVLFPEGTRTMDHPVNAFKPGITKIAKLAKAPIQVVWIDTDSPYLSKGWPIWRAPPFPVTFTVRLGPRLEPAADDGAALVELERIVAEGTRTNVADNRARAEGRRR